MWKYDSAIGTLYICKSDNGQYGFLFDGVVWITSDDPQSVADNVYHHSTCCDKWDLSYNVDAPIDLFGWTRVR